MAELYRVEHALNQAAFAVETDYGVSDEGDPWFVFCHPDGQVVVHIARIGGLYHLFCLTLPEPLIGSSFVALTKAYVSTLPRPQAMPSGGGVVAHPSALLSLLVAAAMFSVDALVQHPAHALELPKAPQEGPLSGHIAAPGAVKETVLKAFSEAFAAAVWRGHRAEGQSPAAPGKWWSRPRWDLRLSTKSIGDRRGAVDDDGESTASAGAARAIGRGGVAKSSATSPSSRAPSLTNR